VRGLAASARRTASDVNVAEATLLHLRYNYRLTPVVHSLVFMQAQRNPFQRIDGRYLLGLGARFDVVRAESWEASIGAAYMRERENLTDDDTGAVGRNRGNFFATLLGRLTKQVLVDAYGFYQPVLNDFSNTRISVGSNLDVALVGELALVVGFRLAYNSQPAPGVDKNDMWLRTGLRFKF
jgi:putative salt-induced outer membrane protein YdiY